MTKITTILFDFDGVIANTEPLYDEYMNNVAKRYELEIDNFAAAVKGTPTPDIVKKYFSHFNQERINQFEKELKDFEIQMDIPPIDGALEFIEYVKGKGYKIGLVTSSQRIKMDRALDILDLRGKFDTEVTADRITIGKPNPMCFLLAAKDLNTNPENCVVFEDSIHGINAARAANMRVIGLTTSYSLDKIADIVEYSIPNFINKTMILSQIEE